MKLSELEAKGTTFTFENDAQPLKLSSLPKDSYKFEQTKQDARALADAKSAETYGALFPANTRTDTAVVGGFKTAGNLIPSAVNLGKSLFQAILNPGDTIKGVSSVLAGAASNTGRLLGTGPNVGQPVTADEQAFGNFVESLKARYGGLENLQRTAVNDPFGFATEIASLGGGVAKAIGAEAALARGVETVARPVLNTSAKALQGAKNLTGKTIGFGVSQATGLNPETIQTLTKAPEAFTGVAPTRAELAGGVKTAIDARLQELSDLGGGYEAIKQSGVVAKAPPTLVESVLNKFGLVVEDINGKAIIRSNTKSITRNPSDLRAVQEFYDNWAGKTDFTPEEYLNFRKDAGELSKFDRISGKTRAAETIGKDIYEAGNRAVRPQIPGLADLDAQYAPEVSLLKQIKKDYLTMGGEFKDGALNKIANLGGKGKDQIIGRLERIVPDIKQRVAVVKATEDIANAFGQKVGTYLRAGGVLTGLATGNIPLIVGTILTNPAIAVPLLRGYGYTAKTIGPIIKALNAAATDINNFRLPPAIQDYIENPKVGLSIEDVTKSGKVGNMAGDLTTSISQAKSSGQSFDEWVKGQGESLQHATTKEIADIKPINATKGEAFYLSEVGQKKASAMATRQGILQDFVLDTKKAKTFDPRISNFEINQIVQDAIDKVHGKGRFRYDPEASVEGRNVINKVDDVLQAEVIRQANKKGYNHFRFYEPSTQEYSHAITDNTLLKTRSQLKAEWDKVGRKTPN